MSSEERLLPSWGVLPPWSSNPPLFPAVSVTNGQDKIHCFLASKHAPFFLVQRTMSFKTDLIHSMRGAADFQSSRGAMWWAYAHTCHRSLKPNPLYSPFSRDPSPSNHKTIPELFNLPKDFLEKISDLAFYLVPCRLSEAFCHLGVEFLLFSLSSLAKSEQD